MAKFRSLAAGGTGPPRVLYLQLPGLLHWLSQGGDDGDEGLGADRGNAGGKEGKLRGTVGRVAKPAGPGQARPGQKREQTKTNSARLACSQKLPTALMLATRNTKIAEESPTQHNRPLHSPTSKSG